MAMLHRLYQNCKRLAQHQNASFFLGGVSFIESTVFPLPPDMLLIPMALSRPERAFRYAGICTLTSVLGAILGYGLGYFFYTEFAQPLIQAYGYASYFLEFQNLFILWGAWIVLLGGLTPFPYKIVTISSGVVGINLPLFILFSLIARGTRFYAISGLLYYFGERIRLFVEKYLGLVSLAVFLLIFGGAIVIYWFL